MRFFVFVLALSCLSIAEGHGRLTQPVPRSVLKSGGTLATWQQNAPVSGGQNSPGFVCRNTVPNPNLVTLNAGSNLPMAWDFPANHVGDCFAYITYDQGKPDNEKKWFKIANLPKCNENHAVTVKIPDFLPPCEHCILRWEWYALHVRPNIEYYAQCVDVKITGSTAFGIPSPTFNIPGHLPADGNSYRHGFGGAFFLVGPPLATATASGGGGGDPVPPVTTPSPVAPVTTPSPVAPPPAPSGPDCVPAKDCVPAAYCEEAGCDGHAAAYGLCRRAGPAPAPTAPAPAPSTECAAMWGKCGGRGWAGATCCAGGGRCDPQGVWYHQCVPGAATTDAQETVTSLLAADVL